MNLITPIALCLCLASCAYGGPEAPSPEAPSPEAPSPEAPSQAATYRKLVTADALYARQAFAEALPIIRSSPKRILETAGLRCGSTTACGSWGVKTRPSKPPRTCCVSGTAIVRARPFRSLAGMRDGARPTPRFSGSSERCPRGSGTDRVSSGTAPSRICATTRDTARLPGCRRRVSSLVRKGGSSTSSFSLRRSSGYTAIPGDSAAQRSSGR